jgi:hypothetical protein
VQEGAGVDVTAVFAARCPADLEQTVAICRARRQDNLARAARSPRPRGTADPNF